MEQSKSQHGRQWAESGWRNAELGPSLAERCRAIEMLVVDVDGVLTDGSIVLGENGAEIKRFHVRDGSALTFWRKAGKNTAIISGRTSPAVATRAKELGVSTVIQGIKDKWTAYRRLLGEVGVAPGQVSCIGDDIPDYPLLAHAGLAVAVADACSEIRAKAHYVTTAAGGRGAVREVVELILRCQGRWHEAIESFPTATLD